MSAGPPDAPLLEVEDLRVEFRAGGGPVRVVEGVSFTLSAGEILALVGESGAGKSVTALSVPRLLREPPARLLPGSSVRLFGEELLRASPARLREVRGREIGVVFQDPAAALNPVRRVGRQVEEALRSHGNGPGRRQARKETERLFRRVGLDDPSGVADAYPHELSGGMRQRVVIAAAVCRSPSLLVADEPTSALDVQVQARILRLLDSLRRERSMGVLLVSHDLRMVVGVADRVAVMYAGRIVEEGRADAVLERPSHPYTAGLLRATPGLEEDDAPRPSIPGEPPSPGRWPAGCAFRPRCRHAWDRCEREPPLLPVPDEAEGGRAARCWLVEEPGDGGDGSDPELAPSAPGERPSAERPEGTPPILEARGVSRAYPARGSRPAFGGGEEVAAVVDLELELRRGEAVGLVGESGAGKSTVARIMAGLESPDAGEVRYHGSRVQRMRREERRRFRRSVQILFQDPFGSLNPRLSIGSALREPVRAHGGSAAEAAARAKELRETVGLPEEVEERYPHELSGGMQQRVALARALVVAPEVLIADEPVTALDVSVQAQVLALLDRLRRRLDLALLLVAHDLAVVRQVCDRVAVMRRGRIVESATADQLFRRPSSEYARKLLSEARRPGLEGDRERGSART